MTVGLLVNETKPPALEAARSLIAFLAERGISALVKETTAPQLMTATCQSGGTGAEVAAQSDFVVVFGGDGTLLSAARQVAPCSKPILAVHLGHFGFLTQVSPEGLHDAVEATIAGKYDIEERSMLDVTVQRNGSALERLTGLNDVVIASGAVRMLHVRTEIGGEPVATYAADGVAVASPTGSTGYSLSAGGPLVHPSAPVFVVTPICPHTLNARPLIIPDTETVTLTIEPHRDDLTGVVSIDGQVERIIAPGDAVTISRAPYRLKLIQVGGPNFYQKIRSRWHYGERVSS